MTTPQEQVIVGAKVGGGTLVTGWLATIEPFIATIVGLLTIAVLVQTIWKNHKK